MSKYEGVAKEAAAIVPPGTMLVIPYFNIPIDIDYSIKLISLLLLVLQALWMVRRFLLLRDKESAPACAENCIAVQRARDEG